MADEEEYEESGGGSNKLMIILIALVVILLLAVGAGGYLLYSKGAFSDQPPMAADGASMPVEEKVEKSDSGDSEPTFNVSIEDLILNITTAKGREKLMKLSFTLKCAHEGCEALIETVTPEIQDAVITQVSARSAEELLTVGGKALFKEELLDEVNAIINEETKTNEDIKQNIIKQLYFTTFVIK